MNGKPEHPPVQLLFVYGTLAPGETNAHILAPLAGRWEPASVGGSLHPEGWVKTHGFPGMRLVDDGSVVNGLLFHSPALEAFWPELDAFEGSDYRRVQTLATRADGTQLMSCVYVINDLA